METKREEYLFIGKIKAKAAERKRITLEELEKLIEITFNHGYNSGQKAAREVDYYDDDF